MSEHLRRGNFPPFWGLFYFKARGDLLVWGRSGISTPCRLQSTAVPWIWVQVELMPSCGCGKWIYRRGYVILMRMVLTPHCQGRLLQHSGWSKTPNTPKLLSSQTFYAHKGTRTGTSASEAISDFMRFPKYRISLMITWIYFVRGFCCCC